MKNDLHIRTNISASSNKEMNWEKVLLMAQENKLERIAITDFDTCLFSVIRKIVSPTKYFSGEIIDGMECDVCYDGITFELLAYNFDVEKTFEWSKKIYGTLETRQNKLKELLIKKLNKTKLAQNKIKAFDAKNEFAHNYVYELINNNSNKDFLSQYEIKNSSDFYRQSTSNMDFPLYVNTGVIWPEPKEVINFIHSVGGIVVLAHPYKYKNKIDAQNLLLFAKENNIDGIEVYHPSHSLEEIDKLLKFAKENKMIITGGSNFNGKEYNTMGIKNIDKNEKEISIKK
ncbi:MAG: hypothetical protein IJ837_03765 [Clostridia bacterium]|nr:hypothetical protein [Clostridia bacterium]